jgi:hypothetical protein
MIFATACFAAYVWSTYYVPETANVSLEEIDGVFRSSVGRDDAVLKRQVRLLRSADILVHWLSGA